MSLITCYDADGNAHQKEPVDAREACLHNGFTMAAPGDQGDTRITEYIPTKQELLAAHADLIARGEALSTQAEQLRLQAEANVAEAQRLVHESELLAAQRADFAAQQAAAVPPVATPDPVNMTKAQLQAALDAKDVKYPAAADKSELQALLTAANAE